MAELAVTGCHNNCLKAEENDMGIKGGVLPKWSAESCMYCGVCEAVCPEKAIAVDKDAKTVTFDKDKCVYCGKCIKSCPIVSTFLSLENIMIGDD